MTRPLIVLHHPFPLYKHKVTFPDLPRTAAVRTQTIATDPIEQLRGALKENPNQRQFPRVHTRACLSSSKQGLRPQRAPSASLVSMKITDEMIEAAAKAIREQAAARSTHRWATPRPWYALPDSLKDAYRAEALVALDAALAVHR